MDSSACPDAFESYYTPACYSAAPPTTWHMFPTTPSVTTWHVVPLSPNATGLVLVLLAILLTTLLVSKPER